MKLLLDEMYSVRIAEQLRVRGHDVIAAQERPDLRELDDEPLLVVAATEERVLLTNNVADLAPILRRLSAEGGGHCGVLFTSDRSMPRSSGAIGTYVDELERFMERRPAVDALRDQISWLTPAA